MLWNLKLPDDLKKLSYEELIILANEVREYILDVCMKNGGHLASSLGATEIIISLLRNFNFKDRDFLVFDVGHQSYAYKILTDRRKEFETIRLLNGLAGFPNRSESKWDHFGTGHSSTSISAALGAKLAKNILNKIGYAVALIGDGALTAGMAFEALNHAGELQVKNLIVILNDNGMSIANNVGALSNYLNKLKVFSTLTTAKNTLKGTLKKVVGDNTFLSALIEKADSALESVKEFAATGNAFFASLGFEYIGPIDGHDIESLDLALATAKQVDKPVIVHVLTQKGRGFYKAQEDPELYHGVGPSFNTKGSKKVSFSSVFGETLCKLAQEHNDVVAITAAMPLGTGLDRFKNEFKDRFFDVGIAEQHAVTLAAGMATQGVKPFVAIYSTFLQRGYDQIVHDVALQNLPVVFGIDRAGIVGADGATHHGNFDIAFLRVIPNMVVSSASCKENLEQLLKLAYKHNSPFAVRYPRGTALSKKDLNLPNEKIKFGKWQVWNKFEDRDIVLLTEGIKSVEFLQVARENNWGLIDVCFIKPLDGEILDKLLDKKVFVIENASIKGSLFSAVLEYYSEKGKFPKILKGFGYPDKFIEHGKYDELLKELKLDVESVSSNIKNYEK